MVDVKELIQKIKAGMDKLRTIEDAKVKEVLSEFDTYVTSLDLEEKETKKTEDKKETVEKSEETKEEVKEEVKEDKKEEAKKEAKVEDKKDEKAELSDIKNESEAITLSVEVSKKLKEAAIELQKSSEIVLAKEEVINVYKKQIMELEAKLKTYTDKEQLELQKVYDSKIFKLIELYKNLGMEKSFVELQKEFSNEQIDKLIVDLSAINNVKVERKIVRETKLSQELELNSGSKSDSKNDDAERAKLLWDFE